MYSPFIERLLSLIEGVKPKNMFHIPSNPKRGRVILVIVVGLAVAIPLLGGLSYGMYLIITSGVLQDPKAGIFLALLCIIGACLLGLGIGMRRKSKITSEYARKWWYGEIPWYK